MTRIMESIEQLNQGGTVGQPEQPTLRDQFAMAALTGMCNGFNGGSGDVAWFEDIAVKAIWLIADAMMETRK